MDIHLQPGLSKAGLIFILVLIDLCYLICFNPPILFTSLFLSLELYLIFGSLADFIRPYHKCDQWILCLPPRLPQMQSLTRHKISIVTARGRYRQSLHRKRLR